MQNDNFCFLFFQVPSMTNDRHRSKTADMLLLDTKLEFIAFAKLFWNDLQRKVFRHV